MLYQFFINSVPNDNLVCQWIKSKCMVESKSKSERFGKKCFNCRFCSSKKEWTEAMRAFLISNGCSVSEIVEYQVNLN